MSGLRPWRHTCGAFVIVTGAEYAFAFCARTETCGKRWHTPEDFAKDPDTTGGPHDTEP